MDFGFLGSAYPLYFVFLKYAFILLTLIFACEGGWNISTNVTGDKCIKYDDQPDISQSTLFPTTLIYIL